MYCDYRSACAQVGVLARRACPLERAAARICKEAGARMASHVALRDFILDVLACDGRRIEVVANGLPIWQGAQIAADATIVSPVRRMANLAHGLTSNRASPSTRQSTANTELTRNCGKLGAAAWSSSAWKLVGGAGEPRHLDVLATACAGKGSPAPSRVRTAPTHACSLLELPIGPSDPSDDQEEP